MMDYLDSGKDHCLEGTHKIAVQHRGGERYTHSTGQDYLTRAMDIIHCH